MKISVKHNPTTNKGSIWPKILHMENFRSHASFVWNKADLHRFTTEKNNYLLSLSSLIMSTPTFDEQLLANPT